MVHDEVAQVKIVSDSARSGAASGSTSEVRDETIRVRPRCMADPADAPIVTSIPCTNRL